jgi:hypothetical protein
VVHPGVYLTTPGRSDWDLTAVAALLWAGPGAALFGRSAARAWSLVRRDPAVIEVVIPADRTVRSREGLIVTRSRHVPARVHDTAWPHRVTASHTVFDARGPDVFDGALRLAAKAIDLRLVTVGDLRAALRERPRQRWRGPLMEALADVEQGAESPAEVRYIRDVERAHGLPKGRSREPFGDGSGRLRDRVYEDWGLVVEIDGRLGHSGWVAQRRDGIRDRVTLARHSKVTVRCYWADLVPNGCALASEVAAILQSRGWTGRPIRCGRGCRVLDGAAA